MNKDLVGQTLLNQFRVDAFVESGGMAAVYRVWDLKRNVSLAMKVLHADLADEPSVLRRFQREANALKKLTHPHIVPFYGMYQTPNSIFLLERFVDGFSLKDILRKQQGKPLGVKESLIYLKALCASLGYAHANDIVHCDVKPGNVMIDISGSIYLTDFGIARYSESTTTSFGAIGTPAYMAPEQTRDETVSAATDIYALGVMFFELLTGQRPFRGTESSTERGGKTVNERIRYGHLHIPPPDPRSINPAVSEDVAKVIIRSLSKKPEDRYLHAQDFFREICRAAGMDIEDVPDRVLLQGQTTDHKNEAGKVAVAATAPNLLSSPKKFVPLVMSGRAYMLIGIGIVGVFMAIVLFNASIGTTNPPNNLTASVGAATQQDSKIGETSIWTETPEPTVTPTKAIPTIATQTQQTEFLPVPWSQYDCPDKGRIKLKINDWGKAVIDRIALLEQPAAPTSPDYKVIRYIQIKEHIRILNGPQCVNGVTWWEITTESSNTGWSQEFDSKKGQLMIKVNR